MTVISSISHGSQVCMHVRLELDNGFVVEDTFDEEPLCFIVGDGSLETGLESLLIGMQQGEQKQEMILPGKVFPLHDSNLVQSMVKDEFSSLPLDTLQKGLIIDFDTPSGDTTPGMIVDVGEDEVTVDFNHPLSGKAFTFKVVIVKVT